MNQARSWRIEMLAVVRDESEHANIDSLGITGEEMQETQGAIDALMDEDEWPPPKIRPDQLGLEVTKNEVVTLGGLGYTFYCRQWLYRPDKVLAFFRVTADEVTGEYVLAFILFVPTRFFYHGADPHMWEVVVEVAASRAEVAAGILGEALD